MPINPNPFQLQRADHSNIARGLQQWGQNRRDKKEKEENEENVLKFFESQNMSREVAKPLVDALGPQGAYKMLEAQKEAERDADIRRRGIGLLTKEGGVDAESAAAMFDTIGVDGGLRAIAAEKAQVAKDAEIKRERDVNTIASFADSMQAVPASARNLPQDVIHEGWTQGNEVRQDRLRAEQVRKTAEAAEARAQEEEARAQEAHELKMKEAEATGGVNLQGPARDIHDLIVLNGGDWKDPVDRAAGEQMYNDIKRSSGSAFSRDVAQVEAFLNQGQEQLAINQWNASIKATSKFANPNFISPGEVDKLREMLQIKKKIEQPGADTPPPVPSADLGVLEDIILNF